MSVCYFCGFRFLDDMEVYRSTECPQCGRDVKICRNCIFYSPGSKWDCRETVSEQVADKERSNFCDYFVLGNDEYNDKGSERSRKARDAFNSLFGGE